MTVTRLLLGSPVRQQAPVLEAFLASLERMDLSGIDLSYYFIDDNEQPDSSALLERFAGRYASVRLVKGGEADGDHQPDNYRNEYTHIWKEALIWKVAAYKDSILSVARNEGFDGVFLIDSDLILHPKTLQRLVLANKEIVSNVFWTSWQPGTRPMPQVWLHGEYEQYPLERRQTPTEAQKALETELFYGRLRMPGVYEVGGLGACTLISREAIEAGVSFAEISNLGYWGEDRHFCVRASALGLKLYVETTHPAYHLYRGTDLEGMPAFVEQCLAGEVTEAAGSPTSPYDDALRLASFGYEIAAAYRMQQYLALGDADTVPVHRAHASLFLDDFHSRRGNGDEGRAILLRELLNHKRAELYCRLGAKCMDREDWREAAIWYKQATKAYRPFSEADSPDPAAWTWKPYIQLCLCYEYLGDRNLAYYYNNEGLRFDPRHPGMLSNKEFLERVMEASTPEPQEAEARIAKSGLSDEDAMSRFIREDDAFMLHFTYELPEAWWSRRYEYAWASRFLTAEDTVLDAASGVCHPFKFFAASRTAATYAFDLDPRILSRSAILDDIADSVSPRAKSEFDLDLFNRIQFTQCDMTRLPYEDQFFDKVFCISVLEHVDERTLRGALEEFRRVLKNDGLLVLTVDYPNVDMKMFAAQMDAVGWRFAGMHDFDEPDNAISTTMWGPEIKCIRLLLAKRPAS
ncbi:methyltransferase domain-containing protein [Cohnella hashimotonis]|uniref:Methyltransferase domain-containing protein n=1 Tax=Cohnella hashimotonis TaxID=2826895 RepID=A0ABT6TV47_9BACL|nr:methyltransferase domain-containing protein [Cohnella hashimotonis]MDI4649662.1 methyltransferase domain-containing protein [Cohnella hashimotonis]